MLHEKQTQRQRSVLFVCMGNICRSPTGEGVMRHLLRERGVDDRVTVDSAGTIDYHAGKPADARMRRAARARGYRLDSIARQVRRHDLHEFDLVVAMDRENLFDLQELEAQPTATVTLLSAFLGDDWPIDVPDPYYGGPRGFEDVIDMIEQACPRILETLLDGQRETGT